MESKKIIAIHYNWFYTENNGEEYQIKTVGEHFNNGSQIVGITEHPAMGEGDKWYYDIEFSDGSVERVFNPNSVFYK